jgi:hypothetical protein
MCRVSRSTKGSIACCLYVRASRERQSTGSLVVIVRRWARSSAPARRAACPVVALHCPACAARARHPTVVRAASALLVGRWRRRRWHRRCEHNEQGNPGHDGDECSEHGRTPRSSRLRGARSDTQDAAPAGRFSHRGEGSGSPCVLPRRPGGRRSPPGALAPTVTTPPYGPIVGTAMWQCAQGEDGPFDIPCGQCEAGQACLVRAKVTPVVQTAQRCQ